MRGVCVGGGGAVLRNRLCNEELLAAVSRDAQVGVDTLYGFGGRKDRGGSGVGGWGGRWGLLLLCHVVAGCEGFSSVSRDAQVGALRRGGASEGVVVVVVGVGGGGG
jgi:hypothetical protein